MKSTTLNVSFYCRPCKVNKVGLAPVELSIIINGERVVIPLPRKEEPAVFKKSMASKRKNAITDYTDAVRHRLNEIITEMMEEGVLLTAKALGEYFHCGGVKKYTIGMLFDEYISLLRKRDGVDMTHRTFRKYELARDRLYTVISSDSPVTALTNNVIVEYIYMLRKEFNTPTTNGYAQKVKTVVKYGMSKGIIKLNPFTNIRFRRSENYVEFLTEEEIAKIRDTDCKNDSLNRMRDLFVFQASCGLSYCDMADLVQPDFKSNADGQLYIHKKRNKTGVYFTSVILPDGVRILKKYGYKLPTISNQKYNAALKFIKDICEIEKPLHTHIARHTYATRCINAGIRLEVVAKLLGHSTTKLTQHYAKLLEKNIVDEVRDAFSNDEFSLAIASPNGVITPTQEG